MKAYPEYKDSRLEWIGAIPADWDSTRIKFLANGEKVSFIDGDWIESPYITDDGIRLVQTGNVGIGTYKEQGYRFISQETFQELNCTEVFPNDVLICRLASPVGRACLAPELGARMITSVDNCILKPSKSHDPRFIVYQLSNSRYLDYIDYVSRGSTRARISRSMLGDLGFVAPPLPEQQAIAGFLNCKTAQIDTLIEKKQRQIDLLQEQRTALINHAVTKGLNPDAPMKDSGVEWLGEIPSHWILSRFRWACLSIRDGTHTPPPRAEGIHRLLSARNIVDGEFITRDDDRTMSPEDFEILQKSYTLEKGDIVIAIVGATTGKSAIVGEMENLSVQRSLAILRPSNKFRSTFLNYWIYTPFIQNSIQRTMTQYAAQPGIYLEDLSDLRILMPPLSEQDEITAWLNNKTKEIDISKSRIELQIKYLSEYRTALISEAVTGKIDVREWKTVHEYPSGTM